MRILWIPHTAWAIPQRAHHFCRELAERHDVHVTDWVANFTTISDYLSRRYVRNFAYRRYQDGRVTVHGIPRVSPSLYLPPVRRFNSWLFQRCLQAIITRERIDVVVGTFVAPPPAGPRLVFDVFDDNVGLWLATGRDLAYAKEIAANESAYLRRADAVVVVSSVLADRLRMAGYEGAVAHIPNGVRLDDFRKANGDDVRRVLNLRGPVVGLVGNHDRWHELEKVFLVSRRLADLPVTFLIVGRGAAISGAREVVQKEGLTNVRFAGFVPIDSIAPYFAAIDVGLGPYQKNAGTDAICPMRVLAHAAAGSAVVCTNLEEVRRMGFSNVLLVDDDPVAMADGVRVALTLPRKPPTEIVNYDLGVLTPRYERILAGAEDRLDLEPVDGEER